MPLYVPLHVVGPASLLVFARPYSDVVTPAEDPRLGPFLAQFPQLASFAVTYATNCWSDPAAPVPVRSLRACQRHREAEMATLQPRTIIAVGEAPCQQYLGVGLAKAGGQLWQHGAGAYVVPLPEGDLSQQSVALIQQALDRDGVGYYDLS